MPANAKLQSAMEYLMTYGWAILVIAIVLASLVQLGVLNVNAFSTRAQGGSCQVFRPNGPLTTAFTKLQGVCNNELPQLIAKFNAPQNGCTGSSNQGATTNNFYAPSFSSMTINFWYYPLGPSSSGYTAFSLGGWSCQWGWGNLEYRPSVPDWYVYNGVGGASCLQLVDTNGNGVLMMHTLVLDGNSGTASIYDNGVFSKSATWVGPIPAGTYLNLGILTQGCHDAADGYMANMQIYNSSLSANQIATLYKNGIGSPPVQLSNLVGWWPLNGDANDYSGNGYHAQIYNNVSFTEAWTNYYPR